MWKLYKLVSDAPEEFIKKSDSCIDLKSEGIRLVKELAMADGSLRCDLTDLTWIFIGPNERNVCELSDVDNKYRFQIRM
jgi:hypothetical protein